jgi:acyl-CoA synthetase (AMP-forming)/AMP-acid ligase II
MLTIGNSLRMTARRVPEDPALTFEDRNYTYAELDAAVDRTAAALRELGLVRGDRALIMATNSDRYVVALYAVERLGAISVPINPLAAAPEAAYMLEDSGAKVFIYDPSIEATVLGIEDLGIPTNVAHVLCLGTTSRHTDLMAAANEQGSVTVEEVATEDDDALIMYTSGTTGRPKGVLLDHKRSMTVAVAAVAMLGQRVGDRLLHVAPLYHAAALGVQLIPGMILGAKHIVHAGFDPVRVVETMEREKVTMFFGPPTMYQLLLKVPGIDSRDLSAWRTGLYGAAPMPKSVIEAMFEAFPQTEFVQFAGQTEAGPGGIYLTGAQSRERPGTSGRQAFVFLEVRVIDAFGADVSPGDIGEMILRGQTIMKEYWNKPEATAAAFTSDGWLRTGDLVRLDPDGYMTMVDRLKDLIITGGLNVYSAEVENALAAHPDVLDVAVVSRPHETYGESIVAVVVPVEGKHVDLESIREFCADKLAKYKIPHAVETMKELPRNPSGKIMKHRLRDLMNH